MGISYTKLWVLLDSRNIQRSAFRRDLGLTPSTMSKLQNGEPVSLSVLMRICLHLGCDIGDVCQVVRTYDK